MKFLIHSNAPTASTGYGVQCAQLCERLIEAGHEVAVSCTWGQQAQIGQWTSPKGHKVRLYPVGYEVNSNDIIHDHALHFFDGDPEGGWIVPLLDVWCLKNPLLKDFKVAAWTPVDHLPVPPDVLEFFVRTGAIPIAMSRFGEELLRLAGRDPLYVPLSVDTSTFRPVAEVETAAGPIPPRQLFDLPEDAYVVGMVAMNKGWARDRKGFNEAFRAFGAFVAEHPEAVLFMHSEKFGGAEGINLVELAQHCAIPEHSIVWSDQYAYRLGLPPSMMAAAFSAMDVLLAPSHGEGFGVPLIEAQACGTPVIVSDFSSQPELVGAGWIVSGQLEWDPAQHASYICPYTADVLAKLNEAYASRGDEELSRAAIEFAADYDSDSVFDEFWRPVLDVLDPPPPEPRPELVELDIIVPAMREGNAARFFGSLDATTDDAPAVHVGEIGRSYAENVNALYASTTADWVLIVGDDVEFTEGWLEAAIEASRWGDVIGTNDSEPGRVRNPDVAAGRHADHFLIRRSYIEDQGSSLDGPGSVAAEVYRHWYVDKEIIELAKARGAFRFAEDCRIIHHHPGFDGDEGARNDDPLYSRAVEAAEEDQRTFLSRAPLIEMHRA